MMELICSKDNHPMDNNKRRRRFNSLSPLHLEISISSIILRAQLADHSPGLPHFALTEGLQLFLQLLAIVRL